MGLFSVCTSSCCKVCHLVLFSRFFFRSLLALQPFSLTPCWHFCSTFRLIFTLCRLVFFLVAAWLSMNEWMNCNVCFAFTLSLCECECESDSIFYDSRSSFPFLLYVSSFHAIFLCCFVFFWFYLFFHFWINLNWMVKMWTILERKAK